MCKNHFSDQINLATIFTSKMDANYPLQDANYPLQVILQQIL